MRRRGRDRHPDHGAGVERPQHAKLTDLEPILPFILSYVLSFLYFGILWNNQHHMFQSTKEVGGGIRWAHLHLLFWLSLIAFTIGQMDQN